MAAATSNSDSAVVINSECLTLPQCCTEVNEVSSATSEMVMVVTQQIVEWDDKKTELVTGKEHFRYIHFSNSELVIDNLNLM